MCLAERSDLMNIWLPPQYTYTTRKKNSCAYVSDGILYVEGFINYEDLAYSLAYELNGCRHCYFCGKRLTPKNRTLDHLYPRRWGGVSLPENLKPSCTACNNLKSDMTEDQFKQFLKLTSQNSRIAFHDECIKKNLGIIKKKEFIIPPEWITMYDASELIKYLSFRYLEMHKMEKLEEYYHKYHQYTHPIIVSSNDWLFKGKHILYLAKKMQQPVVPAIILENVVVIRNAS